MARTHFVEGQILFREGDPADSVLRLLSGAVEVTRRNSDRPRTGSRKNISPRLHSTASKLSFENESACPSQYWSRCPRSQPH
jgi:CRP-like cAMP-binding protein